MSDGKFLADEPVRKPKSLDEFIETLPIAEQSVVQERMSDLLGREVRFRLPKNWTVDATAADGARSNISCTDFPQEVAQVAYQPPVMYDVTYRAVTQADWDRAERSLKRLHEFLLAYRAVTQADWDRAERSLKRLHEFLLAVRKAESVLPAPGKVWP